MEPKATSDPSDVAPRQGNQHIWVDPLDDLFEPSPLPGSGVEFL
jgi:hypothetical protein